MRHGGNVWDGGEPCRWLDFSANLRPEASPALGMEALHAAADVRYYPDRHMTAARRGLAAYLSLPEANTAHRSGPISAAASG